MSTLSDISSFLASKEGLRTIREREFSPSQLQNVLLLVHEERLTGQVILDINQGGLCTIRLHEEKKSRPNS